MTTTTELLHTLRYGGLRVRTGLWLLPPDELKWLPDKAARLGIDLVDLRQPLRDKLSPEQRFLRLGVQQIIDALDKFCADDQRTDCLLVANSDLLIAGLDTHARKELWESLYNGYPHRRRAVILLLPDSADDLMPIRLEQWQREGRLVQ